MSVPNSVRRPRRIIARTIVFGASALLAAGLLTWSPSATTGWNQGSAEATLWQLLNGARTNNGLAPVQQHGTLVGMARGRSADMLNRDYFSHTIPGCGCLVYTQYDSNGVAYDWAGENIGWNSGLERLVFAGARPRALHGLTGPPRERARCRFTHGGVGAAAADNKMFQGYVQNTRMYTELFMQARAPPRPGSRAAVGRKLRWRWRWRRAPRACRARRRARRQSRSRSPSEMDAPPRPESIGRHRRCERGRRGPARRSTLTASAAADELAAGAPRARRERPVASKPATATMASAQMEVRPPPRRSRDSSTASSARCSASSSADSGPPASRVARAVRGR